MGAFKERRETHARTRGTKLVKKVLAIRLRRILLRLFGKVEEVVWPVQLVVVFLEDERRRGGGKKGEKEGRQ